MSEYQYYDFIAIEKPLSEDQMAELRYLSSRASITPISFTNYYNWGDFKGNTEDMMKHYFDAHVYVANWMTAIFKLRIPIEALDSETAYAVAAPYSFDIENVRTHWIITWRLEESENYERFALDDGRSWMTRLVPIRDELLRGDLRSLYIGWLSSVYLEDADDNESEPIAVSGLGKLTAAQQALAEFLDLDPDLLAGAAMGNPYNPERFPEQETDKWISEIPRDEADSILKQLLEGKGQQAERSIKIKHAAFLRNLKADKTYMPRRTIGELKQNFKKARDLREEREKQERRQLETKCAKEHEAYLKQLSEDFEKVWKSAEEQAGLGSGKGYDKACSILNDIAEAYALFSTKEQFRKELKEFMAGHMRRKSLIQRLVEAGIWEEK